MENKFPNYCELVRFLGEALGERYKVAFYSAEDLKHPVFAAGLAPTPEEGAESQGVMADIMNSVELKKMDFFCSASVLQETTGKKRSVFYVRDDQEEIVGFLCIFEKENAGITVRDVFNQLLDTGNGDTEGSSAAHRNIGEEMEALMDEHIRAIWSKHTEGKSKLNKEEKIAFIAELCDSGLFRMKGAAERVSEVSGISSTSVYRYLGQVLED